MPVSFSSRLDESQLAINKNNTRAYVAVSGKAIMFVVKWHVVFIRFNCDEVRKGFEDWKIGKLEDYKIGN